jgi:hypothetical protein
MPQFRTTKNIFVDPWNDELFDPNWMDSNTPIVPPKINWDYQRQIRIEDVDIWEVIYFQGGNKGLYAAWSPYAEFYLITNGLQNIETFYGKKAGFRAYKRAIELGMPIPVNKVWVDEKDMWLYKD